MSTRMTNFPGRLFPVLVFAAACTVSAADRLDPPVARAIFNADGSINQPVGYRQWQHVGSTLLPKGRTSIIDLQPIATDELMNAYVEPTAYRAYMKNGVWPEGTRIVKEFVAIKVPGEDQVLHEDHYAGLTMIVKDSTRFPEETAHLGYFAFGHQPEPYSARAMPMPRQSCSTCHEASAKDQQNIFADRHIGLKR